MAKVVYTAEATVTGGREKGHGKTTDGELDVQLRPPNEGGGTNPEQLFAGGAAAREGRDWRRLDRQQGQPDHDRGSRVQRGGRTRRDASAGRGCRGGQG